MRENKMNHLKQKGKLFYEKEVRPFYERLKERVRKSIRYEILVVVAIGFIIASSLFGLMKYFINHTIGEKTYISYEESRKDYERSVLNAINQINVVEAKRTSELSTEQEGLENEPIEEEKLEESTIQVQDELEEVKSLLEGLKHNWAAVEPQVYLVDSEGKLLFDQDYIASLDLIKVVERVNNEASSIDNDKFLATYPVIINGKMCYLFTETKLTPVTKSYYSNLGGILAFISAIGIFIVLMIRLTRKKIAYIEYLSLCLGEIAKGDLSYNIEVIGEDELAEVARNITIMEVEIQKQIEAQMAAEQLKNELVTNVAHDLRTPLTSIIGYIGLAKDKGYQTEAELEKYLEVAYSKSEKLKVIIEDLFELTKLHQGGVELYRQEISITNLLNQLIEELMPLANEKNIEIKTYLHTNQAIASVDINKMTRVFENLIENAIKYSEPNETIYIEERTIGQEIYVAVSNPCYNISEEEIERFFDRFYRADQSRNSEIGGSGLGLAIAKNIVELHQGKISAQLIKDLICFKVALPKAE